MSKQPVLLQPSFVLHRVPYLNSSLLVTCFTKDYGVMKLIAKGANRPKSKLALQQFVYYHLSFTERGGLGSLYAVELAQCMPVLGPLQLAAGIYINELVINLLHIHDAHNALFSYYQAALKQLSVAGDPNSVLRNFEIQLLEEIGYGLEYTYDHYGQPIRQEGMYVFSHGQGFQPAANYTGRKLAGASILAMGRHDFSQSATCADAKYVLQQCLLKLLPNCVINSRMLLAKAVS